MKKLVLFLLISTSFFISVSGQKNNSIEKLKLKMHHYTLAVEKYDAAFLDRLFDDKMIVTSGNGSYRNKQQELNDLLYKIPGLTLEYFVTDSLRAITSGNTGVITGLLRWKFIEQDTITRRSFTFTFVRKKDWQILAQHIGRITNG